MQTEFTPEQLEGIAKVQKLMALASGNANEHEAAAATERANFILARLNLEMDDIAATNAQAGKAQRGQDMMVGGFYQHERDLWRAIAELNFCWYATVKVRYDEETAKRERRKYAHHHQLIGRHVNMVATRVMADYLLKTIERLTQEYCELERPHETFHPRSSTAVSFRQGCAGRLMGMLRDRRFDIIMEERRKERERQAQSAHPSSAGGTGTALVISNLIKSEYAANYDFKYGEGAYARAVARQAEYEEQDRKRTEEHERRMREDPAYRKAYEKAQQEEERKASRRKGRTSTGPAYRGDHSAYAAGYQRGGSISLDQQIDKHEMKRLS